MAAFLSDLIYPITYDIFKKSDTPGGCGILKKPPFLKKERPSP